MILLIVIANSGVIYGNSIDQTNNENLFTTSNDLPLNSTNTDVNSIDESQKYKQNSADGNQLATNLENSELLVNDSDTNTLKNNDNSAVENSSLNNTKQNNDENTANIYNEVNTPISTTNNSPDTLVSTSTSNSSNILGTLNIGSIYDAVSELKRYVEKNSKLPDFIIISEQKLSMSDFLYLIAKAIVNINNKNNSNIDIKKVKDPSSPTGSASIKGKLYKSDYIDLANRIVSYIEKNGQSPNYAKSPIGYIQFQSLIDGLSRILNFYKTYQQLPNYVSYDIKSSDSLNKYNPKYNGNNAIDTGSSNSNLLANNKNGVWLFAADMFEVDFNQLVSYKIGNIFLNEYAFTKYTDNVVKNWVNEASKFGIKVHIWIQAFYYDGTWINPIDTSTQKYNQKYFDSIITRAKKYLSLGVGGIHLDYLRYPGTAYKYSYSNGVTGTKAITEFTKQMKEAIKTINPNAIFSAALMWETTVNAYYYGQDINELGKYLDVVIPMIYRYNQKGLIDPGADWIRKTAEWFSKNSGNAEVWGGLMTYKPLNQEETKIQWLSSSQLSEDSEFLLKGGVSGIVFFRLGIANLFDLSTLSNKDSNSSTGSPSTGNNSSTGNSTNGNNSSTGNSSTGSTTPSTISLKEIHDASYRIKNYISKNGKLPNYVEIGGKQYSIAQYLYLASAAIVAISSKNSKNIANKNIKDPSKPTGSKAVKGNLYKEKYLDLARRVLNYIISKGQAPNYAKSPLGYIQYQSLIDGFSRILNYYRIYSKLPNYVLYNTKATSSLNKYLPKYIGNDISTGNNLNNNTQSNTSNTNNSNSTNQNTPNNTNSNNTTTSTSISLSNIKDASTKVKAYIDTNGVLPNYVEISGKQYSMAQFLYLLSTAIANIDSNVNKNIDSISAKEPSNPTGSYNNGYIYKKDYLDLAKRISEYIKKNGQAPNYASSPLGNIPYEDLIEGLSRILNYHTSNNVMPNYVSYNLSKNYNASDVSEDLENYLINTKNAPTNNAQIIALAKELTNGKTTDLEKAIAIFNYVRDKIAYNSYLNTIYGAIGSINKKVGNCVDMSHVIIALSRAINLPSRYVHGTCYFPRSSKWIGHVWVEIYIDGKWVVADATSSTNTFGVINNWNTKTYTLHNKYSSLPF
jgi:hypothetical protein